MSKKDKKQSKEEVSTKVSSKDAAKLKDSGKDKKKDKQPAGYVFNPSILAKTLDLVKSVVGDSEHIDLSFRKKGVYVYAETTKGKILLVDTECITEGVGEITFKIPKVMWTSATNRRAKLTIEKGSGANDNFVHLSANNYNVDLHYSDTTVNFDTEVAIKLDSGVSADPVISLVSNFGHLLYMTNYVEGVPLTVMMRWNNGHLEAAQMSQWHGMVFKGPLSVKSKGEMTLPQSIVDKLKKLGGEIGFKGKSIAISSDRGLAEFVQLDSSGNPITIDNALSLVDQKAAGSFVIDGVVFETLVTNAMNVTEWGTYLTLDLTDPKGNDPKLGLSVTGRHGKVTGSVEISEVKGTLPKTLTVTPNGLSELGGLFTGPIEMMITEKSIRIRPVTQGEWTVTGFVCLVAL